jgi:catechol 2,3-dioxygenase-like lactoylglutathione lyase family enzyme
MRAALLLPWMLAMTLVSLAPASAIAQTTAPYLAQDSLNVFRRFDGDGAKTLSFYGDVLGLGVLNAIGGVSRFEVGTSQLKFTRASTNAHFTRGAIDDTVGIRLWTIWLGEEAALTKRFIDHGYPAPAFKDIDGARTALVTDPDGEWVQLVIAPSAPKETYARLEVGIAAADLEKSRAFYRSFVGLEELPPVTDPVLGKVKYPFRHGTTTISLWAAPGPRPSNPSLAGIQYVVNNVDAVNALAEARHITVEQPLRESLPGLRTVWLQDPDGVTNYFAQILPRRPPATR